MRAETASRLWIGLLTALLLSGCGAPAIVPEDRFYRLAPLSVDRQFEPASQATLVIDPVSAYDVYRERAIAYSPAEEPEALQHHHYHFWFGPPPELVREQLVDFLQKTGIARSVATDWPGRGQQAIRLAVRLTRFERVFEEAGTVSFAVGLQVTLDDDGTVLLRRRYERTTRADDPSFAASVRTADEGLAQIYRAMTGDIAAALDGAGR